MADGVIAEDADTANSRRFRVVHLSDLHFGADFDPELWQYVVGQLQQDLSPVDLILISGDVVDSPSFFGLGMARQEIRKLERDLKCGVIVIAGNHDMGLLGNLAIWPFSSKFDIVFDESYAWLFDRLPRFTVHAARSWYRRWWTRSRWAFAFAVLRTLGLLRRRKAVGDGLLDVPSAGTPSGDAAHALVVGFNSSRRAWLATGRVSEDDALRLDTQLATLRQLRDVRWMCPRIALVHHHVLPIPFSDVRESWTEFEPFLVLRNSGTLVRQLAGAEFDLVLHGHKHYWNAVRMEFDSPDKSSSVLAVIGAGSGTVRHDEPGRNSFNVIDLMPNGSIVHRPVFFGRGMTAAAGIAMQSAAQPRLMLPLPAVKRRALAKAIAMAGSCSDVIEREVDIDEHGSADYSVVVRGFRVLESRSTRRQTVVISLSSGAISQASARLHDVSRRQGHWLDTSDLDRSKKLARLHIDLGREVYSQESSPTGVDYGVQCRATNTFAISEWEARELDDLGEDDWVGLVVRQPARRATLRVRLPKLLRSPQPEVIVRRPSSYPGLRFSADGSAIVPENDEPRGWEIDQDMTNLEKSNLRLDQETWQLEIDTPMVGFRYEIRWRVSTELASRGPASESGATAARASARAFRQQLLRMTGPDAGTDPVIRPLTHTAQTMLEAMFDRILAPEFRAPLTPDEKLAAALFVYDDRQDLPHQRRGLRLVMEAGHSPRAAYCNHIPLNEGVTGAAFKTRRQTLYVAPPIAGRNHDGAYVYYPPDNTLPQGRDAFWAVAAVPLFLGSGAAESNDPEVAIGVFTLSSNAPDSGLLKLMQGVGSSGPATDVGPSSNSALWSLARSFVNGLADELRRLTGQDVEDAAAEPDNDSEGDRM